MVDYQLNNSIFRVIYGDITKIDAEALVSSDDNFLSMGGGVSAAIKEKAGEFIQFEALKHTSKRKLSLGDVVVTSAGRLPAKYVFHVITIDREKKEFISEESIRTATRKCLHLADILGLRILAFPALGTGHARFPIKLAADVMSRTIATYLLEETNIEVVIISLFIGTRTTQLEANEFIENVVPLASISAQSNKLKTSLNELEKKYSQTNYPDIYKKNTEIRGELDQAQKKLEKKAESSKDIDNQIVQSGIIEINNKIFMTSNKALKKAHVDKQSQFELFQVQLQSLLLNKNQLTRAYNACAKRVSGIWISPKDKKEMEDIKKELEKNSEEIKDTLNEINTLAPQAIPSVPTTFG